MNINISGMGKKGELFGLPHNIEDAELIVLPVCWDVTTSYKDGTSQAPQKILEESFQLDLEIYGLTKPSEFKVSLDKNFIQHFNINKQLRAKALKIIDLLENGIAELDNKLLKEVNNACENTMQQVYEKSKENIAKGKFCAVLGGEHSSPLGLMKALNEKQSFGILQIDAHKDLRNAYEGFKYSHASIMNNAMQLENITHLVQVGIRDYCEEELQFIEKSTKKTVVFYDQQIKNAFFEGKTWEKWVTQIIDALPKNVYISFDIDGLNPSLCPNTGTPVPGGLSFEQADYLLSQLVKSGKKIIGFDLCEVGSQSDWDANVGARVLYRLCSYLGASQGKIAF